MRSGACERASDETIVRVEVELDGSGNRAIETGLPMLDHMLAQLAFHSGCDLRVAARSLDRIEHHVVEDVAIVLGRAIDEALSERRGIARYGCATIPMDDALARAAIDLGGRAFTRVDLPLSQARVEGLDVVLVPHFFASLASAARLTLHVDLLAGSDPHHAIEACFKAVARALRTAWKLEAAASSAVPSTKGVL
jgi:imidazoleglycerol-phosphate dehydratase